MANAVTVAVRCRPLSPKELKEHSKPIISMEGGTLTTIHDPSGKAKPLSYTFDHSFWSGNKDDEHFVTQEDVFANIGVTLLDNAFQGFNGCLFAYGQTGSGKTYSMMGYGPEKGVIPRLCSNLFEEIESKSAGGTWNCKVQVSYLEIYNEKCKCLLSPNTKQEYRIREHPTTGPYVENLTKLIVHSFEEIERIMEEGNKLRTVAATQMNATSSRSHAIFTVTVTQKTTHEQLNATSEMCSKINLVDLAGSERADRTGATGDTLKEGSNINRSLTTLGKVINGLAEGVGKDGKWKKHVPFRDSSLTWLLKDNLCGNSKTIMIAALSPADSNYDETVSTLRYADRAKNLKTQAVKNEDPSSKKIRELQEEVDRLQAQLMEMSARNEASPRAGSPQGSELNSPRAVEYDSMSTSDKIEMAKKLLREETMTWEEQEEQSTVVQELRAKVTSQQGLGVSVRKDIPSLVNLNEDPMMSGCLLYQLPVGITRVGSAVEDKAKDICLEGDGITADHAVIVIIEPLDDDCGHDASIQPVNGAPICVNGKPITETTALDHGDRVILGSSFVFRYSDPKAPRDNLGATITMASPAVGNANAAIDFEAAMAERVKNELVQSAGDAPVAINGEFVIMKEETRREQETKLADMTKRLAELESSQKNNLTHQFLTPISVSQVSNSNNPTVAASAGSSTTPAKTSAYKDPNSGSPAGALEKKNSLVNVANLAGQSRANRLPNKVVFRQKVVLLGHQEVGKTSLRKCWESDPVFGFFGKKLPEVKSTTGIEAQLKTMKVGEDPIDLNITDFAGQEAYHSHTLFLTDRSIFVLVWKISAVEQDLHSSGISEHEEARLCQWVREVYAKFPKATLAIVATHLDELRDQSQRGVEYILKKVETIVQRFMERIARKDDEGKQLLLPIVGSFAASCKNRSFIGAGSHKKISGQKMSSLLQVLASKAHERCVNDEVFWGGAIPGRHLRLIQELQVKKDNKWLMPLSEYVHLAVQFGIESDQELLQVSQLMHSWNIIYLFNTKSIEENVFIFLHPDWLCKVAGVLFSFSHVLHTPFHLRSIIGGLDYQVTMAEQADAGLMRKGFLRLPLAKVIFSKSITTFLKREPEDQDYETVLQLLVSLELMYKVEIQCEDEILIRQETPMTISEPSKNTVMRYFVPSLSPFKIPQHLREIVPIVFDRGVRVRFDFNFLPNEFWWRLQYRLHPYMQEITVHCPKIRGEDEDTDDEEYEIRGADDVHNRWLDAMYLHAEGARAIVMREGEKSAWLYSVETKGKASQELLHQIEEEIVSLLGEYQGLERQVTIVPAEERMVFGKSKHNAAIDAFSTAVDESAVGRICEFFGIEGTFPTDGSPTGDCPPSELDPVFALDRMVRASLLQSHLATRV